VSLKKIVLDTAAMSSVNMLRILAQFIAVPVLSRLLSPADYGIVGIAMPFILFAMMLADAGIGMSLVRTPASDREEWSTCFWLTVLFGGILAFVTAAFAPLAATLFDEPALRAILTALALVIFGQAVFLIPRAAQQQGHQFRIIAVTEIVSITTGLATAVLIAVAGGGAWALVGQQLVFFALRLSLTLWFSPFRPLLVFDFPRAVEHLTFGRDLLGTSVAGFVTRSLDTLIIGKMLGVAAVGIYSMAFQFARLPILLISGPLQYVLYAQLVKLKHDNEAVGRAFFAVTRILAIVVFPAVGMVSAAHEPVFNLLLSNKWEDAGNMFMLVAPACALQAVISIGSTVRMAVGRTKMILWTTIEFGVVWIITLLVAVRFGLEWVAVSYSMAALLYWPRAFILLDQPVVGGSIVSYLRTLAVPLVVTGVGMAAYTTVNHIWYLSELCQLLLGGTTALTGIAASTFLQRAVLQREVNALRLTLHALPSLAS